MFLFINTISVFLSLNFEEIWGGQGEVYTAFNPHQQLSDILYGFLSIVSKITSKTPSMLSITSLFQKRNMR